MSFSVNYAFLTLAVALSGIMATYTNPDGAAAIGDTVITVEGSDDQIGYDITGEKLLGVVPDFNAMSLIISVEAVEDGSITMTVPRSILDSTTNGEDSDFFVLVDQEEGDFEETVTPIDRTLAIPFDMDTEEIEIIGTHLIQYDNTETVTMPAKDIPDH